jgi:hypothetical protein
MSELPDDWEVRRPCDHPETYDAETGCSGYQWVPFGVAVKELGLKSRDQMDIEAAALTSGLWAPRLEEFAKSYAERVVDSAWGKKVGR